MLKWILRLSFLGLLLALAAVGALWVKMPTRVTPYPYLFKKTSFEGAKEAEEAQILLVGDRMGVHLEAYLSKIGVRTDPKLREPLKVYSWARPSEGLHRTLEKLKTLKQWPKILILHGLSQELAEQRFFLKDEPAILKNFFRFNNPTISSLIIAYPPLSRILYYPHQLIELDEFTPYQLELNANDQQKRMALTYLLAHTELTEIIQLARRHQTQLVFITTPVNLEIPPKRICENSQTPTMEFEQKDVQYLLDSGKLKEASTRIQRITDNTPANAQNYFLKGVTALMQGDFSQAQGALQLAAVYDCEPWRSHAVFNQILLKNADAHDFHVIDFDFMVNQNLGRDVLFLNELFPQDVYYQRMTDELVSIIEKILKI